MTIHCLAEIRPYDPVTGTRRPVRLAAAQLRALTGKGGLRWEPAMIEAPRTSITLFAGDFSAAVQRGGARLPVSLARLRQSHDFVDRAYWPGAEVAIYAAEADAPWPWPLHFLGRVTAFSREKDVLAITAEVDEEPFRANVLTRTYAGTGGAEGGDDLKDRPKPLVLGHAMNVEPVLIDAVNSVYQFSGYGPIEEVTALYERASDFGAATGDHADYAALVAASIAPGYWATCLAEGMIRLGAPAYGVITGDVKGHAVAGATPRLTGAVIQAVADLAGIDADLIDADTLDAMDEAVPYPINVLIDSQVTFGDMARRLALPCNHQSGVSLTGKFFVTAIALTGDGALTLDALGRARPQVLESKELAVSPPYAKTMLGANRSWRVHSADEVAADSPFQQTLEALNDDGILTVDEKVRIAIPEDASLEATYQGLLATATALGLDVSALTTARANWIALRDSLSPAWNDTTQNTPIDRDDWDSVLTAYREAIEDARALVAGQSSITVSPPQTQQVHLDSVGVPKAGEFPRTLTPVVQRGGVDIRLADEVDYAIVGSGVTATVDNLDGSATKGEIEVTDGGAGYIDLTVTVAGTAFGPFRINFITKEDIEAVVITGQSISYTDSDGNTVIHKWGRTGGGTGTFSFPVAFPTACTGIVYSLGGNIGESDEADEIHYISSYSASGFTISVSGDFTSFPAVEWQAWGY